METRMAEVLGEGRFLRLVRGERWEWVERIGDQGVAVLVAITAADELLLVEQHRPPVGGPVVELPAGLAGAEGTPEELAVAAIRELEEETGFRAARVERLTGGPVSAGLSSEVVTFFRAHDLQRVGPGGGVAGESITVHAVPRVHVPAWLAAYEGRGGWVDPKVYCGLWF